METLFWNTQYAALATAEYYSTNEGGDGKPVGPTAAYLEEAIPWETNEAGERSYTAEKPSVNVPELYAGPTYSSKPLPNRFTVTSGYGLPTSGLWIPGKGGKSFGVRGQGNKMIGGDKQEIALSDQLYSFRWPVQDTDSTKCTASYVALTVSATEDNTDTSNKLVL